jgi:hypothetical protein
MASKLTAVGLLLFVSGGGSVALGQCNATLSPYVGGDAGVRLQRITELHTQGRQALSTLLPEIGDTQPSPVTLGNPFLSNRPFKSPTYCGAVAAYLIELVLGRTKVSLREFRDDSDSLLQGAPENYIFRFGYIVHKRSGEPIERRAFSKIARLYDAWWKDNAHRSLESLREDWARGKGPLASSPYEWR